MGRRRKAGTYPYDYTDGGDRRFADSGAGESGAGKFGKEHRLHGTAPGDRITVTVCGSFAADDGCACGAGDCDPVLDELTTTREIVLTGDLEDVVRFGIGPAWDQVMAIDTGDLAPDATHPAACRWGAGVRVRGAAMTAPPTRS